MVTLLTNSMKQLLRQLIAILATLVASSPTSNVMTGDRGTTRLLLVAFSILADVITLTLVARHLRRSSQATTL